VNGEGHYRPMERYNVNVPCSICFPVKPMFLVILFIATCLAGQTSYAADVVCAVSTKYNCDPTGCRQIEAFTFSKIDASTSTYSRCDNKGCDDYHALLSQDGDYVEISLPQNGALAKVEVSSGFFLEVVTLGRGMLISFGNCRAGGQ
jgi:hypothetical protein